jgi:hypothetical protein
VGRPGVKPLLACDTESVARELIEICGESATPPASGLLLAVDSRGWKSRLRTRLPHIRFTVIEFDRAFAETRPLVSLPCGDREFDIVIALDVAAMLPRPQRRSFHTELERVSRQLAVNAMPLGTDLQAMIIRGLLSLHQRRFGVAHRELSTVLANGLPTPDEAMQWVVPQANVELMYAGDVTEFQRIAERLMVSNPVTGWLTTIAARADARSTRSNFGLETVPMRRHRRMFLLSARK